MIQITITDPNQWERDVIRKLLDPCPQEEELSTSCFAPPPEAILADRKPIEPVTATVETCQLDKDGLPWDERIHSSNRKFDSKGGWWRRRGVSDELVAQVEAQLRGTPLVETKEVPPPPPPVVEPENPMGPFIAFVGRTMAAIGGKTLTQAQVDQVCQKHGVSSLAALGQRPELVATVEEELFP